MISISCCFEAREKNKRGRGSKRVGSLCLKSLIALWLSVTRLLLFLRFILPARVGLVGSLLTWHLKRLAALKQFDAES
jgi:hypothetical protein